MEFFTIFPNIYIIIASTNGGMEDLIYLLIIYLSEGTTDNETVLCKKNHILKKCVLIKK